MSVEIADPRKAVAGILKDHPLILELTEGRVWCPKMPDDDPVQDHMPHGSIVVSGAAGSSVYGDSYLPLGTPRLDVRCYGSTGLEADSICQAALVILKRFRPAWSRGVFVRSVSPMSEPLPMIDPQTLWPFTFVNVRVLYDE